MKRNYNETIGEYLCMTFGAFLAAIGINFMAGHNLAFGRVSGLSIIIEYLTNIPISILNIIINIPLFLTGMRYIGKQFFIRSLYSTVVLSLFLETTGFLCNVNADLIVSAIFGGILLGAGVGIIAKSGGSTGGTDMLALVLHHHTNKPLGNYMFCIDGTIIMFGAMIFGVNKALYSIVVVFFISQAVNETMLRFEQAKAFLCTVAFRERQA